jgi:hypothetical protein
LTGPAPARRRKTSSSSVVHVEGALDGLHRHRRLAAIVQHAAILEHTGCNGLTASCSPRHTPVDPTRQRLGRHDSDMPQATMALEGYLSQDGRRANSPASINRGAGKYSRSASRFHYPRRKGSRRWLMGSGGWRSGRPGQGRGGGGGAGASSSMIKAVAARGAQRGGASWPRGGRGVKS